MKFKHSPSVHLVSRQVLEIDGVHRFLNEHGLDWPELEQKLAGGCDLGDRDAEWLSELAARTCYMSFGRGRSHEEHIKNLIEVGHGSVFEHAYFVFAVSGISRSFSHELVRHRAGFSYSQLSQRYVDSNDCNFVVPPDIAKLGQTDPDILREWHEHMFASAALCEKLVDKLAVTVEGTSKTDARKKARQAARSVLPNATETVMIVGANARAVRHLIEMRAHPAADLEIRNFAVALFQLMKREFPLLLFDVEAVKLPDGTTGVESQHRKI